MTIEIDLHLKLWEQTITWRYLIRIWELIEYGQKFKLALCLLDKVKDTTRGNVNANSGTRDLIAVALIANKIRPTFRQ